MTIITDSAGVAITVPDLEIVYDKLCGLSGSLGSATKKLAAITSRVYGDVPPILTETEAPPQPSSLAQVTDCLADMREQFSALHDQIDRLSAL